MGVVSFRSPLAYHFDLEENLSVQFLFHETLQDFQKYYERLYVRLLHSHSDTPYNFHIKPYDTIKRHKTLLNVKFF